MKNLLTVLLILSCVLLLHQEQALAKSDPIAPFPLYGEIRGVLESCAPGSGIGGALVYIPGISIMAKTDAKGAFRLMDVPPGMYKLVFEVSGKEYFKDNVRVLRRQITNLGTIPICEECVENTDCDAGDFCKKKAGDCGGEGVCAERPRMCPLTLVYDPVCGCDGRTYGGDCEAAAHGVNVLHEGACKPPDSCKENADCGSTALYCAKPEGECNGEGVCKVIPKVCLIPVPLVIDFQSPVYCGCDGSIYGSECLAAMKGVNISNISDNGMCYFITPRPIPAPIPGPRPEPIPIPIEPAPRPIPIPLPQ